MKTTRLYSFPENSMKRIIFYILTALLTMVTLTACGIQRPGTTAALKKHRVQAPIESPALPTASVVRTRQHSLKLLGEKDYLGAIHLIQEEIRQGTDEQSLSTVYLQAVNSALGEAETLIGQGQYQDAATLFKAVQENLPKSSSIQQQVAASPRQINDKIDLCTEKLMEAGLVAYRADQLSTAITIWQQVLEFNPQHQRARSSIQTTQLQLAKLKTLSSKD